MTAIRTALPIVTTENNDNRHNFSPDIYEEPNYVDLDKDSINQVEDAQNSVKYDIDDYSNVKNVLLKSSGGAGANVSHSIQSTLKQSVRTCNLSNISNRCQRLKETVFKTDTPLSAVCHFNSERLVNDSHIAQIQDAHHCHADIEMTKTDLVTQKMTPNDPSNESTTEDEASLREARSRAPKAFPFPVDFQKRLYDENDTLIQMINGSLDKLFHVQNFRQNQIRKNPVPNCKTTLKPQCTGVMLSIDQWLDQVAVPRRLQWRVTDAPPSRDCEQKAASWQMLRDHRRAIVQFCRDATNQKG